MNVAVALVDREPQAALVQRPLRRVGYRVVHFSALERFLAALRRSRPDVVMLNLRMRGMDGREVFRALRAEPANARMILVGLAEDTPGASAASLFDAGADELLLKPVDTPLLLARLQSLLRRTPAPPEELSLRHCGIVVRPEPRVCSIAGKPVRLTRLEFDLLLRFIQNPTRVLTRGNLLDTVWNGQGHRGARAVDRHVHSLRLKLGAHGRLLRTLVGIGYCLDGSD